MSRARFGFDGAGLYCSSGKVTSTLAGALCQAEFAGGEAQNTGIN